MAPPPAMNRPDPSDSGELPPIPTPETDPRLRIPDILAQRPTTAAPKPVDSGSGMAGMVKAWGVAFDFVGTILGGALLGYGFDFWQGTTPVGVLSGLGFGFTAALVRIIRRTMKEEAARSKTKPKP